MLTENEWNTINNMLLELYTSDELDVFTSKIMKMIRMLSALMSLRSFLT